MADFDALRQHAGRYPPASGIDVQAADASLFTSDAPTHAARAIHETRSLAKAIGMVPSRNGPDSTFDGIGRFILGDQSFVHKLDVPSDRIDTDASGFAASMLGGLSSDQF